VALISHLPVLVSAALIQAADRSGTPAAASAAAEALDPGAPTLAQLVRRLASSGFEDTTRVGGGNPELGALMAQGNRAQLLAALGQYRQALADLEQLVADQSWPELQASLAAAQRLRPEFL
jgi:arogenate dehydrogenase (NADP+)